LFKKKLSNSRIFLNFITLPIVGFHRIFIGKVSENSNLGTIWGHLGIWGQFFDLGTLWGFGDNYEACHKA
jgi:hypothetical protein